MNWRTAGFFLLIFTVSVLAGTGFAMADSPADTRIITDDYGREVVVPASVDRVIPSGPLALAVLISFDPKYPASCANGLPAHSDRYLPELENRHLPQTGGLFTSTNTVNYEEIMRLKEQGADVYIDLGEKKATGSESLSEFSSKTGMPAIFISQKTLDDIPESYRKLGDILGEPERGAELADYIQGWVDRIAAGMKTVEESGIKCTAAQISYMDGNNIYLLGGFNDDRTLGYTGTDINTLTDNVVTAKSDKGLGDSYGMEEVMNILGNSDPNVIFINGAPDHAHYRAFIGNPAFSGLSAVKNGRVYEIPYDCPYGWTTQPFSGWDVCGLIWMANILYPDVFTYSTKEEIQKFYQTMIGYTLTDEEYYELTAIPVSGKSPVPAAGILLGLAACTLFLNRRK